MSDGEQTGNKSPIWTSVTEADADLAVGRPVPVGQPDRAHGVMPDSVQELRESGRQLRVDQELHAVDSGTMRRRAQ